MFFATVLSLVFAALVANVIAAPVSLDKKVVYSPPITSPDASTVWMSGSKQVVTWDTSDIPENITQSSGMIVLGYLEDGDDSLHLQLDTPLADDFDLKDGRIQIVVPDVEPKSSYILVLFGDSGNKSPEFTITNEPLPSSSSSLSVDSSASGPSTVEPVTSSYESTTTIPLSLSEITASASATERDEDTSFLATTVDVTISSAESPAARESQSGSESDGSAESDTSREDEGGDGALAMISQSSGMTMLAIVATMTAYLL